jgi:hypothetical protein
MPGFCFILFVGKNVPSYVSEKCFVGGHGNPIIVTSIVDRLLLDEAVRRHPVLRDAPDNR